MPSLWFVSMARSIGALRRIATRFADTANSARVADDTPELAALLSAVGPRLRDLRKQRDVTLAELSELTGVSVSTLSRLESGQRRPTLELLLPLVRAHQVTLDELLDTPTTEDPRVRALPFTRHGWTFVPLTRSLGGLQAYKMIIPAGRTATADLELRTHEGYEWLYVLSGRLRLFLGEHDLALGAGEAAEFDTRVPHALANAGDDPVEALSLFGREGERIHVRARSTP
jgi:transcriptional regulator with XRE-family HTH domain